MGKKFKTLDNLKNKLLQNQKHHHQQQQPDTLDVKAYGKRNQKQAERFRKFSSQKYLKIDGIIEEETNHGHIVRRNYRKSLKIGYS